MTEYTDRTIALIDNVFHQQHQIIALAKTAMRKFSGQTLMFPV